MKHLKYLLLLTLCTPLAGQEPRLVNSATLESGLGLKVDLTQLSTTGGANKVPQFDANANWTTGAFANDNVIMGNGGKIFIPDKRGIEFLRRDGSLSGQRIYGWDEHGMVPGTPEMILESPERIALVAYKGMQVGPNDPGRYPRYVRLACGGANNPAINPAAEYMPSGVVFLETSVWNGAADYNDIAIQAHALDTSGTLSEIRIYDQAGINEAGTVVTAGRGDATGNVIARIHPDGIWSPGSAPVFDEEDGAADITITCSKYKTIQAARTLLTENRTLAFEDVEPGMRGVIYVTQPASGGPCDLTPVSGTALDLSDTANYVDKVTWEFDGTYYSFATQKNIQQVVTITNTEVNEFIAAGVANITDNTQKVALDNFVTSLKYTAPSGTPLWNKIYGIWTYVGRTSTAHALSLKPTTTGSFVIGKSYKISVSGDTDFTAIGAANSNVGTIFTATGAGGGTTGKAFRVGTFSGTVSHIAHASGTIQGDGINGYFNTGFFRDELPQNDVMFSVYSRTQTLTTGKWLFGSTGTNYFDVEANAAAIRSSGPNTAAPNYGTIGLSSDFRGHIALRRTGSTTAHLMHNATESATAGGTSVAPEANKPFLVGNTWFGTVPKSASYTECNFGLSMASLAFTTAEWSSFRTINTTFQTTLGRQN